MNTVSEKSINILDIPKINEITVYIFFKKNP